MKYFKQNLADICAQGAVFKDAEFDNCEIGLQNDMQNLPLIKGVRFINCKFTFCFFGPAIFEDVLFENIKFEDYGRLNSPFFRRTKFKGKFS